MIKRLCDSLLRYAASRWPASVAESMLEEWQAELHAEPRPLRRLRFAASLALARPHRPVRVLTPVRASLSMIGSALLLTTLPIGYALGTLQLGQLLAMHHLPIGWWAAVWALTGGAAVAVGVIGARWTASVARVLPAGAIAIWTFGLPSAAWYTIIWVLTRSSALSVYLDRAVWAGVGIAGALLARRLWRSRSVGHGLLAAGAGALVAAWLIEQPFGTPFAIGQAQLDFGLSPLAALGWVLVTNPALPYTLTSFAYALSLIRRRDKLTAASSAGPAAERPATAATQLE